MVIFLLLCMFRLCFLREPFDIFDWHLAAVTHFVQTRPRKMLDVKRCSQRKRKNENAIELRENSMYVQWEHICESVF